MPGGSLRPSGTGSRAWGGSWLLCGNDSQHRGVVAGSEGALAMGCPTMWGGWAAWEPQPGVGWR